MYSITITFNRGSVMAKQDDNVASEMASRPAAAAAPAGERQSTQGAFTIKVIQPGGELYHTLDSSQLGAAQEVIERAMLEMVKSKIPLRHEAYEGATAQFAGTFIVNLSSLVR